MLRCQMRQRCTTLPHQDARSEADAANGASAHSQPQTNASAQPVVCAGNNSATEKRALNSGAIVKSTITTSMHTVLKEVLVMTMSCTHSNPWIRKHLKYPANLKLSSGQLQTQRSSSSLHRTRINPPQLPLLMTSRICLDVKRLSAWTMKSWTSSGSTTSRGTALRIYEALCTYNTASFQVCAAASTTCNPPCNHPQQPFLTGIRASLESSCAQQLAPLWTSCCQRVGKQLCSPFGCQT